MIAGRRVVAVVVGIGLTMGGALEAQTLSPHKAFGRYQQFIWQDQHSLPQNTVRAMARTRDGYAMARTRDGYLWLANGERMTPSEVGQL